MIVAPYRKDKLYDELFEKVIINIRDNISDKDDDFLMICVGTTGTGKTSLALHAYELFDPEGCSVDFIGLDKEDHAKALKKASVKSGLRFCMNDEANVTKRDALTKYNKDMISMYFAIRGLKIFHWWNNPSIDYLEKMFINERLKGVIFVFTKDVTRPRLYYYFRKHDLLRLLEKHKSLSLKVLKTHGKSFAFYRGWFKSYNGVLWDDYLVKKKSRMVDHVESFFENYGGDTITHSVIAKKQAVDGSTVGKWAIRAINDGVLVEGVDFIVNGGGKKIYTEEGAQKLIDYRKNGFQA